MMVTELTKGIEGTDIKAGVIKLASSFNEITPTEEIFFKAAARAQKETGCVIITHTQPVSYTHLDVYKRQLLRCLIKITHIRGCVGLGFVRQFC